tara:strand:+ start:334 stop:1986 length:1653 start_codon:yes stop_codon:yes gene_type:complete
LIQNHSPFWLSGVLLITIPVMMPIGILLYSFFMPSDSTSQSLDIFEHIRQTVLPIYLYNTLLLMAFVGIAASIIGISTAWITSKYTFPLSTLLTPALVLPLAAPAYVVGYVYADLLEYAGPIQTYYRLMFNIEEINYYFPSIRSLGGAAFVISLVLYPYIYLLARASFTQQSVILSDAARVLGASKKKLFWKVALPVARPAIAGGIALVLMETIADYGVVEHFGVPTFTIGIFRTWYGMGEHTAALQLAGWLFIIVTFLVIAEQFARKGQYFNPISGYKHGKKKKLTGLTGLFAMIICLIPVIFGFVIPFFILIKHAISIGDPIVGKNFSKLLLNSFYVATLAAFLCSLASIWLSYSQRLSNNFFTNLGIRISTLGYAIPGMILAIAMLVPLSFFDKFLSRFLQQYIDGFGSLLITGSVAALIFVYIARFLTISYNSSQMGMNSIHYNLDAAARTLGSPPWQVLKKIHIPLFKPAVLSGFLLVFIDIIKELPATLILRPFNFETLATRVYRLASDERISEASTAALTIIFLGLVPIFLILINDLKKKTFK